MHRPGCVCVCRRPALRRGRMRRIGLRTFQNVDVHPSSPFVTVRDATGRAAVVRKRSLVHSLSTSKPLMNKSASRSERVRAAVPGAGATAKRAKCTAVPTREEELDVGEWAAFRRGRQLRLGRVLCFRRLQEHLGGYNGQAPGAGQLVPGGLCRGPAAGLRQGL